MFFPKVIISHLAVALVTLSSANALSVERPFYFNDDKISITLEEGETFPLKMRLLTENGWEEEVTLDKPEGEKLLLELTKEGIYLIQSTKGEVRFLVAEPPTAFTNAQKERLQKLLPKNGKALLSGKPFHILAMGDSVTATGEFPEFLKQLLSRATGNPHITAEKRAHSGKSVDASVRQWAHEIPSLKAPPQLTLIEYGLNDQAAGTSRKAYIEQIDWLRQRLTGELKSDVVLMEATPHIEKHDFSIARTFPFSESLRQFGARTHTPVVPTFKALWRDGGLTFEEAAKRQWPYFPLRYNLPFTTLLESHGKGDTIHPNALGHLAMARAIFRHLTEEPAPSTLTLEGETRWVPEKGLVTQITLRASRAISGTLTAHLAGEVSEKLSYQVTPNSPTTLEITWKSIQKPADLLQEEKAREFRFGGPYITLLNQMGPQSEFYALHAPLPAELQVQDERLISETGEVPYRLRSGESGTVTLPKEAAVAYLPTLHRTANGDEAAFIIAATRFAGADRRTITLDADLTDWEGAPAPIPLGEKEQARGAKGPIDHRASPEEAYLHWNFAAGEKAIHIALRGKGNLENDTFVLFFDPRPADQLGSAGPYFWIDGKFDKEGRLFLKPGQSSLASDEKPHGVWKKTDDGLVAEFSIPYALLGLQDWPKGGDLGASILWRHQPKGKEATQLLWAETGHPWNTRNFGVIRLDPKGPLPYRVRIE